MNSTTRFLLVVSAVMCVAYGAPSKYSSFGYAVNDPNTLDYKDQQELRNGDSVVGYYRLADSDGALRTVNYRADALNGFTAHVDRSPGPNSQNGRSVQSPVPYSLAGWPNTWPAQPANWNFRTTTK